MAQAATAKPPRKRSQPRQIDQKHDWAHGCFHWNELRTRDAERARRFYAESIGWSFEASSTPDGHTYWVAMQGGKPVAGLFPLTSPQFDGVPESWMSFLAVDDVDKRVARAVAAGAELVMPIFDVPGVGRIAMLREPGGAGIGWMTPVGRAAAKA
jgi:uncharacterized protein